MSRKIKSFYTNFIYYSGLFNVSRIYSKEKQITILCYHKIRGKNFANHMNYLIRSDKKLVSMDYAYQIIKNRQRIEEDLFAITFDDGYLHNYEECFSIIKNLNIPVIIYLATNHVGNSNIFWWDRLRILINRSKSGSLVFLGETYDLSTIESRQSSFDILASKMKKMGFKERDNHVRSLAEGLGITFSKDLSKKYRTLDWRHVKEMHKGRVNFGSHTSNHVNLPYESEEQALEELLLSKKKIENEIGEEVVHFAYPNGDYNEANLGLVKKAGYKTAVLMRTGFNYRETDLFKLNRISINSNDKINDFVTKIKGWGLRSMANNFQSKITNIK